MEGSEMLGNGPCLNSAVAAGPSAFFSFCGCHFLKGDDPHFKFFTFHLKVRYVMP